MNDGVKFLGALAFFLLLMFGIGVMLQNAILGIIIIFLAILTLAITLDPASAKALIKIFFPVVILMLFLSIILEQSGGVSFDTAIMLTLVIFAVFILIGAFMGGAELKSMIILAPLIVIPTLFAFLADPTGNLAIIISSSLVFGFLMLSWYLIRGLGPAKEIEVPIKVGIAVDKIDPYGRVKLGGEVWRAFSMNWKIKKDEKVYVVGRKGLELVVVPAVTCPACGEEYPVTRVPPTCRVCGTDLTSITFDILRSHMKSGSETSGSTGSQ